MRGFKHLRKAAASGTNLLISTMVLWWAGSAFAQPPPKDPVEGLRQALHATPEEIAARDPEFADQLKRAKPENLPKVIAQARERYLTQRVNALHNIGQIRQALALPDWQQESDLP